MVNNTRLVSHKDVLEKKANIEDLSNQILDHSVARFSMARAVVTEDAHCRYPKSGCFRRLCGSSDWREGRGGGCEGGKGEEGEERGGEGRRERGCHRTPINCHQPHTD